MMRLVLVLLLRVRVHKMRRWLALCFVLVRGAHVIARGLGTVVVVVGESSIVMCRRFAFVASRRSSRSRRRRAERMPIHRVVAEIVHEQMHHLRCHVRKLDRALMNGAHQQVAVLNAAALRGHISVHSQRDAVVDGDDLLLEARDNVIDVVGRRQLQHERQNIAAHVEIRRAQPSQNVHDNRAQIALVANLERVQPLDHNELHVLIRLGLQQSRVRLQRLVDSMVERRQRQQSVGCLVGHRVRRRVQEFGGALDKVGLGHRQSATHFAHQLQNGDLHRLWIVAQLVLDLGEHAQRGGQVAIDQHLQRIALARVVALVVDELHNALRRVRNQVGMLLCDRNDGQHTVLAHVRVTVLQVLQDLRYQLLQNLCFVDATQ
mmetsp:Transcript_8041/g.12415  ORF Transcript_8041/g.12415 Transcript_8041/m.12415 type:complete len:376 (+) Transcript_8041:1908-3035(+)